jgi:acetolactate synthase-1/2/3 large subunit
MPSWAFVADVALTADSALTLPLLEAELAAAAGDRAEAWQRRCEEVCRRLARVHEEWRRRAQSELPADQPEAFLAALNAALPRDAIVLEEAVTNRPACQRQIDRRPGQYFSSGAPSLGWTLGAGIGAALAAPDRPVIGICGDGSFHFGNPTAALWSANNVRAPFLTVVLNNAGYYASKRPVLTLYPDGASARLGRFPETEIDDGPDLVGVSRACGGDGSVVTAPGAMAAAVEDGLSTLQAGRCAVIDVRLPRP